MKKWVLWLAARRIGEVGWKRMAVGCCKMERNSSRASAGVELREMRDVISEKKVMDVKAE